MKLDLWILAKAPGRHGMSDLVHQDGSQDHPYPNQDAREVTPRGGEYRHQEERVANADKVAHQPKEGAVPAKDRPTKQRPFDHPLPFKAQSSWPDAARIGARRDVRLSATALSTPTRKWSRLAAADHPNLE
jgi:hypothetical protein